MKRPEGAEDREIIDCSKAAYLAALRLEQDAQEFGIDPAFHLAETMIEKALARNCGQCRRFYAEVADIMRAREFCDRTSLYVLHDEPPARYQR